MVEQRPTHGQAFLRALKEAVLMVGSATIVCGLLFYLLIFHSNGIPPGMQAQSWWTARFTLVAFPLFMIPLLTLGGWMQKRSEPTRSQVEARERAEAKRLLAKYPDLG